MRTTLCSLLVIGGMAWTGFAGSAHGDMLTFDFKDPKGVNAIAIRLDSLLEPFGGHASGISGTVRISPTQPHRSTGHIVVEAASIAMTHPRMTDVLHTDAWLDVATHPTVEFEIAEVLAVRDAGTNTWNIKVKGPFTLKGVTRELEADVSVTWLPGRRKDRNRDGDGDLLVLRTRFTIDRTQYGLQPEIPSLTVARDIHLDVAIVGFSGQTP